MANLQKGVLDKVQHFLNTKKFPFEVIIVDDGSTDGGSEFVKEFSRENPNFKLIQNTHLGKGAAVTHGVLKARGKYILFTDMDQATPIDEVDKLFEYFDSSKGGYDIVIGSRNSQRKGSPWTRILMAKGMIFLRNILINMHGITDTQCGFKLFRYSVAQKLFRRIEELHNGFKKVSGSSVSAGFDVELLYIASKMGYKIKEVPVNWLYVETRRVNPISDSIKGIVDLILIKVRDIKGEYK